MKTTTIVDIIIIIVGIIFLFTGASWAAKTVALLFAYKLGLKSPRTINFP